MTGVVGRYFVISRLVAVVLLAVGVLLTAACEEGSTSAPADTVVPALSLAIVSGDSQTGEPGRLLDHFLVFRVTDAGGRPVVGLRVEWEVVSGGGKVSGKRHETDVEGLAAGNFTIGPEAGKNIARAVVRDSLAIEFTAFGLPSPDEEPLGAFEVHYPPHISAVER